MPILDRFRSTRPDWEHADPQVRAEAVRRLGRRERELLVNIARTDEEARVRRVAVHKLDEPDVLTEVARTDADEGVRDEANEGLLRLACQGDDEGAALQALEALPDARQVATVARDAKHGPVRAAALARVDDPRARGILARTSDHADTRLAALEPLTQVELLLEVAQKSEHRDVALAALGRIGDEDAAALEEVASHGRNKAAARRARTRLDKLRADAEPSDAPAAVVGEREAEVSSETEAEDDEKAAAPQSEAETDVVDAPVAAPPEDSASEERDVHADAPAAAAVAEEPVPTPERVEEEQTQAPPEDPAITERASLCRTAEDLSAEADSTEALQEAWSALAASELPAVEGLQKRFDEALARRRRLAETLPAQLAGCTTIEALLADDKVPSNEEWDRARDAWKVLEAAGPIDPELARRVAAAVRLHRERTSERTQERKQRLRGVAERLEALSSAETLDLREAEAALREAREALTESARLPSRREREQLLERIRAARASIFPKAQELREADEWTRWANVATLEELCGRVETLTEKLDELNDLDALAKDLRDIDARWKEAHPVPRDEGTALWSRFRKAREPLRKKVGEHLAVRREERQRSLARRKQLAERAEELRESTSWVATAKELQELQAEWKTLPPVGRRQSDALWKRFHEACQAFFERRKADLQQRRKGQAESLEKKQALIARAEALKDSTDWENAAAEIRKLQAEWKQTGAVRKSRSDAVWKQFKDACDGFFERYRHKDEIVDEAAAAERASACEALEALLPESGAEAAEDLAASVRQILERWKGLPPVRGPKRPELDKRFADARDALVRQHPESFAGSDLDPAASLPRRQKLCERVEAHLPSDQPVDLATQLREALATNAMGGASAVQARAREAALDIKAARGAWERLGPVIGDESRALEERFESACRRFHEAHPNASAPPKMPSMRGAGPPRGRGGRGKGRRPR